MSVVTLKLAMELKIGILALQGDFDNHARVMNELGISNVFIRKPSDFMINGVWTVDALIVPGGESTTMIIVASRKIEEGLTLWELMKLWVEKRLPVYASCAGMILMASEIFDSSQECLKAMPTCVERNAYGRQIDSFEATIHSSVPSLDGSRALFIRAPKFRSVGGCEVLGTINGEVVGVRFGNFVAVAFHAELIPGQLAWHRYFIEHVCLPNK